MSPHLLQFVCALPLSLRMQVALCREQSARICAHSLSNLDIVMLQEEARSKMVSNRYKQLARGPVLLAPSRFWWSTSKYPITTRITCIGWGARGVRAPREQPSPSLHLPKSAMRQISSRLCGNLELLFPRCDLHSLSRILSLHLSLCISACAIAQENPFENKGFARSFRHFMLNLSGAGTALELNRL